MSITSQKLTRIGVFYDGNFFRLVSNYYTYVHARQTRISIAGLHEFIRHQVAEQEGSDAKYCQVVDAHYFRGRVRAQEADERKMLLAERLFEDVLMREGVTTHYLPMGPRGEKGIDVWLALEAFELAMYKRFDVLVLIACDGDFVPLVRKLNTLGTRVMLLGWDFAADDRETRTSQNLIDAVTYPVLMHQVIDDRSNARDPLVNALFLRTEPRERPATSEPPNLVLDRHPDSVHQGTIQNLKEGYGFITPADGGTNIFFAYNALVGIGPADLRSGMPVEYSVAENGKGPCAVNVRINHALVQALQPLDRSREIID